MRTFAETQALRAVELATTPLILLGAAVVMIVVFTGLAGRIALYLETLPARLEQGRRYPPLNDSVV
ncbi:MAG: hypothetical protein IH941_06055 [Acidobacteria bacterium]|nr:hypothetical protein [Acidobacteriota bacterium]